MPDLQEELLSFFERVAQKDQDLLSKLAREPGFELEQECWCFTLPELYSFLQSHGTAFHRVEYSQFRQLIFRSAINQTLKAHGAEITLHSNRGKVDQSRYALIWQDLPT